MARERNPRVLMREGSAALKRRTAWLVNLWTVDGTVYESATEVRTVTLADGRTREVPFLNGTHRKRLPEEYPESQAPFWRSTFMELSALIEEAETMKAFAAAQYRACMERNQAAPE